MLLRLALENQIRKHIHRLNHSSSDFMGYCLHLWMSPTTCRKLVRYISVYFWRIDRPLSLFIANQLEVIALERLNSPYSGIQISCMTSVTAPYEVIKTEHVWRLVHRATGAETPNEEVVGLFQGIICKKDLPPFMERLGYVKLLIMKVTGKYWLTVDPIAGLPDTCDKASQ